MLLLFITVGPPTRSALCLFVPEQVDHQSVELVIAGYTGKSEMGRSPCCSKQGLLRGAWTQKEDTILSEYIRIHGDGNWRHLPEKAGLKRCGKSCRLRWKNYLCPDIKRGNISPDEEDLIVRLHRLLGNRWSLIAGRLPGRTDNEIKNYWNSHLCKKLLSINETQPKSSKHNLNRRSDNPASPQNYVYRAIPVKATTAVRQCELENPNSSKGSSCSEIHSTDPALKLSNIKETKNSSQPSYDLLVNNDSKRMTFDVADVNLVEIEGTDLPDLKLPHSHHFEGRASTLDGSVFDLPEICSSQSVLLPDLGVDDFYSGPATFGGTETNEIEYVCFEQTN